MITTVQKIPRHLQIFPREFRKAVKDDHRTAGIFRQIPFPAQLRAVKGGKPLCQKIGRQPFPDAAQRFDIAGLPDQFRPLRMKILHGRLQFFLIIA